MLFVQQSQFDATRAPEGKHTGYAYCHVPRGSTVDMTERSRARSSASRRASATRILARQATAPADFER